MKNQKVNAIEFYNAWLEIVNNRKVDLVNVWKNSKLYTNLIKGDENCILNEIAIKLNLLCYPYDYYSVDAVFYKEEDMVPEINKDNFWIRDFRIAFEHENNFHSGLYQEVSHLLIMNCDLRVLVTYPNGRLDSQLEYLHKVISGNRCSNLISNEKSFLIIFGYENGFQWEGYFYTTEKWEKILN